MGFNWGKGAGRFQKNPAVIVYNVFLDFCKARHL